MDSPDIDLSFFMPQKRNKRQSDSGSICGSTTFSSYDFIEKIFKIDVAIVEITNIIQAQSFLDKRCCRVLFVIGRINFKKSGR